PIGQRLKFGGDDKATTQIIGVVADVKNDDFDEAPDPTAYLPFLQNVRFTMSLVIRGTHDPTPLAAAVRSEVQVLDPNLPVSNIKTIGETTNESISDKRLMTYILPVVGRPACVLAPLVIRR